MSGRRTRFANIVAENPAVRQRASTCERAILVPSSTKHTTPADTIRIHRDINSALPQNRRIVIQTRHLVISFKQFLRKE
jgi:hypothetical protein